MAVIRRPKVDGKGFIDPIDVRNVKRKLDELTSPGGRFGGSPEMSPKLADALNYVGSFTNPENGRTTHRNEDGSTTEVIGGVDPTLQFLTRAVSGKGFVPKNKLMASWKTERAKKSLRQLKHLMKREGGQNYTHDASKTLQHSKRQTQH